MGSDSYIDFAALKEAVAIEDILARYELIGSLHPKGKDKLVGPCPLCSSQHESAFQADTNKNFWYCFSAEGGGSVLDFVAEMEDTDLVGAANLITEWMDKEEEEEKSAEGGDTGEVHDHPPGEFFASVDGLCSDELALIHDGATRDIQEALSVAGEMDPAQIDKIAADLADWVLRAYRCGYQHGKMTGTIEGRVSSLRNR